MRERERERGRRRDGCGVWREVERGEKGNTEGGGERGQTWFHFDKRATT